MRIVDLTHTIKEDMPVYPGTLPPSLKAASTVEKDGFKETLLSLFSHTGTHIDAPAHLFAKGCALDTLPAAQFAGKALVIDCRDLGEGADVTMAHLAPYGDKVGKADFLLFCFGWDKKWGTPAYFESYPCLGEDVMAMILAGNYKGIGLDTISLDPIADAALPRHKMLLGAKEIINIENLSHLDECGSELFDFACLPLKYENADGAPARAIAWVK